MKIQLNSISDVDSRQYAIDEVADAIYWCDDQARILDANGGACEMVGYSRDELIAMNVSALDPKFPGDKMSVHLDLLRRRGSIQFETIHQRKDGHLINVEIIASRIKVNCEQVYCAVVRDITTRELELESLRNSEHRFCNIANASLVMIWNFNTDMLCNWCSKGFLAFTGRPMEQELGDGWKESVHPDDLELCLDHYRKYFDLCQPINLEYRLRHHSGEYHWIYSQNAPHFDNAGVLAGYISSCIDINYQKKVEKTLRLSASVFEHAQESIIITDAESQIVSVNKSFTRVTGYSSEEVLGKNPRILQSGHQPKEFYQSMWQSLEEEGLWSGEMWNCTKSGELYAQLLSITVIKDEQGNVAHYVGVSTNIVSLKDYQYDLEHHVQYDSLTGLPNRVLLNDRMQQALAHAKRSDELVIVCYLGLDGLSPINDSAGNAMADLVLIEVAKRISNTLRSGDTVARLGEDKFVILLLGATRLKECTPALDRVLGEIFRPIYIKEHQFTVSASVGVTAFPNNADDIATLLEQADQAMDIAKQCGKNRYYIFDPTVTGESCNAQAISSENI